MNAFTTLALSGILSSAVAAGDPGWPMLHGNARHTGFTEIEIAPPFRLAWARQFDGERLGTAIEPIVGGGKVFVATHQGGLWALDAAEGHPLWRFSANGPFLHSPAWAEGLVLAASADGNLYALEATDGQSAWSIPLGQGGCSAAPVTDGHLVLIGTRRGDFFAIELITGKVRWRRALGAPIRQTAAMDGGMLYVTSEDMRVHCLAVADGEEKWVSDPLDGQTARDYYPIIASSGGRALVVLRSSPVLDMARQIGRDRTLLCRNAGVDDKGWEKVDAWVKSETARGTPELWAKEQGAVRQHLHEHPEARTFFVLNASSGDSLAPAPVLWVAGCQGVGAQPAVTADGRLLVFYRSAYGNWNHGVAPLVALGLLDLAKNHVTPLFHASGRQPPWNTFWGTADESQNFVVAGQTVLVVHQGTLSGFDLCSNRLFLIHGDRDTYGGFQSPPWARNEWHGPGRGGVAVVGSLVYWVTGSRLLCLAAREEGQKAGLVSLNSHDVPTQKAPPPIPPDARQLRQWLRDTTTEMLSKSWAPLLVEPGLAGREFLFDNSGELLDTLAWVFPHLDAGLQEQVRAFVAKELAERPPLSAQAWHPLNSGARRELFRVREEQLSRLGHDKPHHPFGNLHAFWRWGARSGNEAATLAAWPKVRQCFADFTGQQWRLDATKGDVHANRYLASLLALVQLAEKTGDTETAAQASRLAEETTRALMAWWKRAAEGGTLASFKGAGELDPFIGKGDAISFRIAPHRHKVALFHVLTPEVAALVRSQAPDAVERVWAVFDALYATWPLMGEERQVHYGENYLDPPDLAMGAFAALAWLKEGRPGELAKCVDLPFCRADLFYLRKLAITLETMGQSSK